MTANRDQIYRRLKGLLDAEIKTISQERMNKQWIFPLNASLKKTKKNVTSLPWAVKEERKAFLRLKRDIEKSVPLQLEHDFINEFKGSIQSKDPLDIVVNLSVREAELQRLKSLETRTFMENQRMLALENSLKVFEEAALRIRKGTINKLNKNYQVPNKHKAMTEKKQAELELIRAIDNSYDVRYSGSITIKFRIEIDNVKKDETFNHTFNVINLNRIDIIEKVRLEVLRFSALTRNDFEHYNAHVYVSVELPGEEKSEKDLSFLFFAWKDGEFRDINGEVPEIIGYNDEFITPTLKAAYEEQEYMNCFPVYLLHELRNRYTDKLIYNSIEEVYNDFVPKGGVNLKDIDNFCRTKDIRYYIVDEFDNLIASRSFKDSKYTCLIFAVYNNHVYPVSNSKKRRSIVRKRSKRKYNTFAKSADTFEYKNEYLWKEVNDMIDSGVIIKNTFLNGKPTRVGNIKYSPHDIEELFKICKELEIGMKAHPSEILKEFNMKNISFKDGENDKFNNLPTSTLNPDAAEIMNNLEGKGNRITVFRKYENADDIHSLDTKGCHMTIFLDEKTQWPKYLPYNKVESFKTNEKIHRNGMYYIRTEDNKLFSGSNWYQGFNIIRGREVGIEFDIEFQFVPVFDVKNNPGAFKTEIADNPNISHKSKTKIFNHNIGSLRTTSRSYTKSTIISSQEAAIRLFMRYHTKLTRHPTKDLYTATIEENEEIMSNYQFIYYTIVERARLNAFNKYYELKQNPNIEILEIRSDAIIYKGKKLNYPNKEDVKLGEWGHEKHNYIKRKASIVTHVGGPLYVQSKMDKFENKHGNSLITGRAGVGKSGLLKAVFNDKKIPSHYKLDQKTKKFIKDLNIKFQKSPHILSYTNKAAVVVNGKTLTSYYGAKNIHSAKQFKVDESVFVDEVYCCPLEYLEYLYCLGNTQVIASGDPYQLIIDWIYKGTKPTDVQIAMMNFVDYMFPDKLVLTECHRYDKELEKHTNPLSPNLDAVQRIMGMSNIIQERFRHICNLNKTVDMINQMYKDKGLDFVDNAPYVANVTKRVAKPKKEDFIMLNEKDEAVVDDLKYKQAVFDHVSIHYPKNGLYTYKEILDKKFDIKDFDLAYAITTHKAQGDTITQDIVIHDVKNMKKFKRLCYTAMTRAVKFSKLHRFN